MKIGQHLVFNEVHMTVPARHAPLAAQALQRLGYYVNETWMQEERQQVARDNANASL